MTLMPRASLVCGVLGAVLLGLDQFFTQERVARIESILTRVVESGKGFGVSPDWRLYAAGPLCLVLLFGLILAKYADASLLRLAGFGLVTLDLAWWYLCVVPLTRTKTSLSEEIKKLPARAQWPALVLFATFFYFFMSVIVSPIVWLILLLYPVALPLKGLAVAKRRLGFKTYYGLIGFVLILVPLVLEWFDVK